MFKFLNRRVSAFLAIGIIVVLVVVVGGGVLGYVYYHSKQISEISQIEIKKNINEEGYGKIFQVKQDDYIFSVSIGSCKVDAISGWCGPVKRKMEIADAKTNKFIQKIELKDYTIDDIKYNRVIEANINNYEDLIFEDINFDEKKDLIIRSETSGTYGGSYYDVYLYDKNKGIFILNKDFTDLLQWNLNFKIAKEKQEIITFNKSGCCYHEEDGWKVTNNILKKAYIISQPASANPADGKDDVGGYENFLYGFKFEYPIMLWNIVDDNTITRNAENIISFRGDPQKFACISSVEISDKTIEDISKDILNTTSLPGNKLISEKEIYVNNIKGKEYRYEEYEAGLGSIIIFVSYNNRTFIFTSCNEQKSEELFYQILSTFKFTK